MSVRKSQVEMDNASSFGKTGKSICTIESSPESLRVFKFGLFITRLMSVSDLS